MQGRPGFESESLARPEWLTPVGDACRQAVREELSAGLESIRRVVREELDREDEESDGEA